MKPNIVFIFSCIIGIFLLAIGVFYYCKFPKKNKETQEKILKCSTIFKHLKARNCAKEDLYYYVDYFFNHYQSIKPSLKESKDLLKIVCLHKHTNAKIILKTQAMLTQLNPSIKYQLNKIVEIRAGIC